MAGSLSAIRVAVDQSSIDFQFARDVIEGLSRRVKSLPCRYLYDARGSELFELITALPEYYPTRSEAEIFRNNAIQLTAPIRSGDFLVEFGSGSSIKTELLLSELPPDVTYMPIDVSQTALDEAVERLRMRFPGLKVAPLIADFSDVSEWPFALISSRPTLFFPGSTIGNLHPAEAGALLSRWRAALPQGARLIIGVDLRKGLDRLLPAYNDAQGITAGFNLNLLARINRELYANFDLTRFGHEAIYDPRHGRIEMHLIAKARQTVTVCGRSFEFSLGESIHTENSYKYSISDFQELARLAGWKPMSVSKDVNSNFSVHELEAPAGARTSSPAALE
jgi:dimethylhistidine N-methyltransferase